MKKLGILFFAALLVVAFTMPAAALETEFGGYWRTRFYTNQNFTGEDESEALDVTQVDTRTRLYFTAILNDNLKFVNKFEFDAVWGDSGYGDIGTDGKGLFEIKHSYADFNVGSVNAKVGAQGYYLGRGFLIDDDGIGAQVAFKGEGFSVPFMWLKAYEGGYGKDANDQDFDYYALNPSFNLGDTMTINPFIMWATSKDISGYGPYAGGYDNVIASITGGNYLGDIIDAWEVEHELTLADLYEAEVDLYYLGVNLDFTFEGGGAWFTGIYENGSVDVTTVAGDAFSADISGYMAALGGNIALGGADVHGQIFYATGQDLDELGDDVYDGNDSIDIDAFLPPPGASYYWAEILGYGMIDEQLPSGTTGDYISNVMAFNIGASVKPMDKLTLGVDLWYAKLAESYYGVDGEEVDTLGTEVDLTLGYELVEGLNLDLVAAYLFAGDAVDFNQDNDANPYELGAQLSLKF